MKISREEAEKLISSSQVVSTSLNQKQKEIEIRMQLADSKTFIVTYDRRTHEKSYKIDT